MEANCVKSSQHVDQLEVENKRLLDELELAYQRIETILEESNREKEVTYRELQYKFETLEKLYAELSKKENLLIHMEKLTSIGEFITELVHELNNPLTVIRMQAELALMKNDSETVRKQFDTVLKNSDKMLKLLERFQSFAYKGKEEFQVFNLNECLRECCETVDILKPKKVSFETRFTTDKLMISGDFYQINQVILNLSKNAFDAINDGNPFLKISTIRISSSQIRSNKDVGKVQCLLKEKWSKLLDEVREFGLIEISDNGSGITSKNLKRLFEAFFTTKERGKGTGLGLSISKEIVLRHGGNLAVKSQPGNGTTFQFFIPLVSN